MPKDKSQPEPSAPSPLLTVQDVAAILAVSAKTVRRWIAAGELPVHRLGRSIRISDADLQLFIRVRRHA